MDKLKYPLYLSLFFAGLILAILLFCKTDKETVGYLYITIANTGKIFSPLLISIFLAGMIVVFDRFFFFTSHILITKRLLYQSDLDSMPVKNTYRVFRNIAKEIRAVSEEGIYSDDIIDHAREAAMAESLDSQEIDRGRTWLEFLGVIAPTVGFMGTLVGLIASFQKLGAGGELSGVLQGLGLSMTTSLLGAIISVIFLSTAWILGKLRRSFDERLCQIIASAQRTDNF